MNTVHQKIVDAIIAKAEQVCPDSLALLGIYGSVATGDAYAKSDLDLLMLIQDDDGWKLGTGFILDDSGIGYDLYCTNWEGLRFDATCPHAQLAKLMDAKIIYVKNQDAYRELCQLRTQAKAFLQSGERFQRVGELIEKAKVSYANAHLHETIGQVRVDAYGVMLYLLNALMLYHGTYFQRGVKRTFEELAKLPVAQEFSDNLRKVAESTQVSDIRELLKQLVSYAENHVQQEKPKQAPDGKISGTYEEMYSNWRNKVAEAAARQDTFSSFMNLCSLQCMLSEISSQVDIGSYDIMADYHPDCLADNVRLYDACLRQYEEVYRKTGATVKRFANVDAFVADYLGKA